MGSNPKRKCHKLQKNSILPTYLLPTSTVSSQIKRVQKGNFVYQMTRMRLRTLLSTSQTLGATSCSQLLQATGISGISNRMEMVQKGMLVYSMSRMELGAQPATSQQLATGQPRVVTCCIQLEQATVITTVKGWI